MLNVNVPHLKRKGNFISKATIAYDSKKVVGEPIYGSSEAELIPVSVALSD
jgi:hypothetical protein